MVKSVCRGLLVLACGLAVIAPAASAQDDEVIVDPDSPSGREYELPIDKARQQGAAQTQKPRSEGATQPPPIFGEGVEPETDDSAARTSRRDPERVDSAPRTERDKPRTDRDKPRSDSVDARAVAERKAQAAAPEGGAAVAAILGVGAGVLLLGGALGLLLRLYRRA